MQKKYVMQSTHKNMRGFEYLVYSAFSLSLVIVLVLLPLAPMFAFEEDVSGVATDSSETSVPEMEVISEESLDDSEDYELSPQEEAQLEVMEDVPQEPVLVNNEVILLTDSTEEIILDEATTTADSVTEVSQNSVTTGDDVTENEPTAELVSDEVGTTTEIVLEDIVSELEIEEETVPEDEVTFLETTSTSSDDVEDDIEYSEVPLDSVIVLNTITEDDSRFSFSKSECASVGGGSFYCSRASTTPTIQGADRVFSASDAEGDREIYVEEDGVLTQVTSNQSDDDAPFYDDVSNTIVWHRLVNAERYQIIVYDVADGTETQITHDRYNNMEPSRYGDITVWQGWIGNDWEVMLEENGELIMLTDNTYQDVSPRINGNYIIWQAFEGNVWRVKVYDRLTKQTDTIDGGEDGASVENPRFVLVYDTKQENGDVETKGYDLKSGETMPLTATPAPIPEDIPDPEQTGEERALVSPSTQPKTKIANEQDDEPIDPEEPVLDTASSTIVIPSFENATNTESVDETTSSEEIPSIEDVVIAPLAESVSVSTNHIEDVIVTPFIEPIEPVPHV